MSQLSFIQKDQDLQNWYLFTDGASRGNPGAAGAGIYICKEQEEVVQQGYYLGTKTNNQAEYLALLLGLLHVQKIMPLTAIVHIRLDSELIVKQITGRYVVKNPELKILYEQVRKALPKQYTIAHVLRAQNSKADTLANIGVDKKIPVPADMLRDIKL